ncbi:Uncharacterised protein [Pluralibacter gergoviae]|nr:Uncharacterised protein [Pluralibacter gergoviae]
MTEPSSAGLLPCVLATPRIDFETTLAVRHPRHPSANNPRYLLEPEITLLLAQGFTDLRSRMYFDGLWNIGIKIGNQVVNRGDLSGNSRLQKCLWFPLPRSLS